MSFKILNIDKFFNNNAFSYKEFYESQENGDFNYLGLESCYPSEDLPEGNKIYYSHQIPFFFPSKDKSEMNNFELSEQNIGFTEDKYKKIHILGSSDLDNNVEKVQIHTINKKYERQLGFTNWLSNIPLYNEYEAVKCSKAFTINGEYHNFNPKIWHQVIDISDINDRINKISFRNNPSVHIFCITLER
ncbi:hypothetical protein [Alkalihalophilus marmarensis]|uniref:hypothetical protein n=1 Tax=Alkalihalophilus marmarensis TaxID=521377 RepID=UPI002DB78A5A|nr:hypothetical protein [Alkalihalophilus marmarensis]MEC2074266.1 hypothetical protein [Alkalihalophilus marmarensis]